jgi:hypothetical protein
MESADSKIYPGIAREPNTFRTADPNDPAKLMVTTCHPGPYTRRVSVYAPKQYVPGTAAPFIVGADGPDRALFSALDSLIAQRRAPVMIATSIGNGGAMQREASVGLEYDTMSGLYIFARHRARVGSGSHPSGAGACPEPSAYLDMLRAGSLEPADGTGHAEGRWVFSGGD